MNELQRIREGYSLQPRDDFLSADKPRSCFENLSEALENIGRSANLDELDELVNRTLERRVDSSTEFDRMLAVDLHRILAIDRRIGADVRFWAWLGLVRYPHFVAARWEAKVTREGSDVRVRSSERFAGGAVRQTFARLWWAAELTVDDAGDYGLTETLLQMRGFQDTYEAVFGRAFCQYRPALKAFVRNVGDYPEHVIRDVAREFGFAMSSRVLEVLSEAEIEAELSRILTDMGIAINGQGESG